MKIVAKTVDDVLKKALGALVCADGFVIATRGKFKEKIGVHIVLKNPLARLSRSNSKGTLISCFAEAIWYLGGSNKLAMIEYYIPGYRKFLDDQFADDTPGAYGPRLFSPGLKDGEVQRVIGQLKDKPTSRQAVIQFFSNADLMQRDPPCTCTLQFFIRNSRLDLIAHMRSNDAFKGLPHDIFAFTWLQEMVARSLKVKLGTYQHMVGSLHLYEEDLERASKYLDEGWLETESDVVSMPRMPKGEPWSSVEWLLQTETQLRFGEAVQIDNGSVDDYWKDVARILSIQPLAKDGSRTSLKAMLLIERQMGSQIYGDFVRRKSNVVENRIRMEADLFSDEGIIDQ